MLTVIKVLGGSYWPDLVLPVVNPNPDDPFVVRNVTGLEPVNATVNAREYGVLDGAFHTGSHVGKRNIVITLGLNSDLGSFSVAQARNILYGYLMPKNNVTLRFEQDNHVPVQIQGFVESLAPNRFTQDPEFQISIICPKPNFVSPTETVVTGVAGLDPAPAVALVEGNVSNSMTLKLFTGATAYFGTVYIENWVDGQFPGSMIELNDISLYIDGYLWLDTKQGQKRVMSYKPVGDPINLLGAMHYDSVWTRLPPADNRIRVRTPGEDLARNWEARYFEEFGGI